MLSRFARLNMPEPIAQHKPHPVPLHSGRWRLHPGLEPQNSALVLVAIQLKLLFYSCPKKTKQTFVFFFPLGSVVCCFNFPFVLALILLLTALIEV